MEFWELSWVPWQVRSYKKSTSYTNVSVPNLRLFDRRRLREALLYSYPYIPHYLFGVVLTMFGQFMIKEMLSIEAAGLYNIAYRFSLPLVFIVDAFK